MALVRLGASVALCVGLGSALKLKHKEEPVTDGGDDCGHGVANLRDPVCAEMCGGMFAEVPAEDVSFICEEVYAQCGGCDQCQARCYDGWMQHEEHCYQVSSSNTDFQGASDWCQNQGAQLTSVHSPEENAFVRQTCGAQMCWMGLREKGGIHDTTQSEQNWEWTDGSGPVEWTNWQLWGGPFDEPNNWGGSPMTRDERFGFMNFEGAGFQGKWYDGPEGVQAKAICKLPLGSNPLTPPPPACPSGWTDFSGKCYIADNEGKTWDAAESWCQSSGGDLVSIHSAEENEVVRTICGSRICWMGLSEVAGTGNKRTTQGSQQWVWNDGTDISGYTNWKEWGGRYNEPNNWGGRPMTNDERKGFINFPAGGFAGKWYDAPAGMSAHAICEKDQEGER